MLVGNERKNIIFIIWICAVIMNLAYGFFFGKALLDSESRTLFFVQTLVLTFPAGYFSALCAGFMFTYIKITDPAIEILITWFLMVVSGYLQWFVVFPWVFNKMKCFKNRFKKS
jgi:hypothetical protein